MSKRHSKYEGLKALKETVSRSPQVCKSCEREIPVGEPHYKEVLTVPLVNFIGAHFCAGCFEQRRIDLFKGAARPKGKSLDDYSR